MRVPGELLAITRLMEVRSENLSRASEDESSSERRAAVSLHTTTYNPFGVRAANLSSEYSSQPLCIAARKASDGRSRLRILTCVLTVTRPYTSTTAAPLLPVAHQVLRRINRSTCSLLTTAPPCHSATTAKAARIYRPRALMGNQSTRSFL